MKYTLYILTGAPGSGKSKTIEYLLKMETEYVFFDIDWLADPASDLAGKSIYTEASTWKPYTALWFEILNSVYKNKKIPVFFTPNSKNDIKKYGKPYWCNTIEWLLLDCNDATRKQRLDHTRNWTDQKIKEAIIDAKELRNTITDSIDTGKTPPQRSR